MKRWSDITELETKLGAEHIPFGPAEANVSIPASFGTFEAEYAAIRQRVALMPMPQRAVVRLTGADRLDFLHRLITQDVRSLAGGKTVRGFQLNGKGRITADMMILHGDEDTWLELDVFDVQPLCELFDRMLFTEDVQVHDETQKRYAMSLHGPSALAALNMLAQTAANDAVMEAGTHHVVQVEDTPVTVYRRDMCSVPGLVLLVPAQAAAKVYERAVQVMGFEPNAALDADFAQRRREGLRGWPIGWLAFNTARIEGGSPMFHIDFGTDSLPAETSLLDDTTSFTKGCYLGQEVVARMKSLGHPKQILVALRIQGDALPVAGEQIYVQTDDDAATRKPVGVVTSSTLSPVLGQKPIAFAMIRWAHRTPDTSVRIPAEGAFVKAAVQEQLRFLV